MFNNNFDRESAVQEEQKKFICLYCGSTCEKEPETCCGTERNNYDQIYGTQLDCSL